MDRGTVRLVPVQYAKYPGPGIGYLPAHFGAGIGYPLGLQPVQQRLCVDHTAVKVIQHIARRIADVAAPQQWPDTHHCGTLLHQTVLPQNIPALHTAVRRHKQHLIAESHQHVYRQPHKDKTQK